MKVKITGCNKEATYWYAQHIGDIFTVMEDPSDKSEYMVMLGGTVVHPEYWIRKEDCCIISEPLKTATPDPEGYRYQEAIS